MLKRSHQCKQTSHLNDLNNFNNYIDIDKINSQLERADIHKRILTRNIYREYELYLKLVRDLLFISVEKGLNQIYSYPTINDNFLNENEFYSLLEKKISKLIFTNLPFLTVEQLKINEIGKNINNEINFIYIYAIIEIIQIIQVTNLIALMQPLQQSPSDFFRYLHPMYIL